MPISSLFAPKLLLYRQTLLFILFLFEDHDIKQYPRSLLPDVVEKDPGTLSWTQNRSEGCYSLLATWMFPQVLVNGVKPLIALNQSVNSEVFIVFHCHLPFPQFFSFFSPLGSEEQT